MINPAQMSLQPRRDVCDKIYIKFKYKKYSQHKSNVENSKSLSLN